MFIVVNLFSGAFYYIGVAMRHLFLTDFCFSHEELAYYGACPLDCFYYVFFPVADLANGIGRQV